MAGGKVRVLIPTTNGLVEILLLTREDPIIGRSVACIGGTTETADIAAGYHAFVASPTGLIERLFGHRCYRLDVSGRIDAGASWQLGVLVAHALHGADRLAQENDTADTVVWASGSVRAVDLTIASAGPLDARLTHSLPRLQQELQAGRHVVLAVPAETAASLAAALAADPAPKGIELFALREARSLCEQLGVPLPDTTRRAAADASAVPRSVWTGRRALWLAAAVLVVIAAGVVQRARWTIAAPEAGQQIPPAPPEAVVPETIPYLSAKQQAAIRAVYLAAPDHKALAVGRDSFGMSTGQHNDATAQSAALATCERFAARSAFPGPCDLYAVGDTVAFARGRPPMPPQPWIIRDRATERPFALAELPLVDDAARQAIEQDFLRREAPRALALSADGHQASSAAAASEDEAARRALEWCGSKTGASCMIVAIDDAFVVPIPKTAKVTGFVSGAIKGIAPELREPLVRRLGNATSGWNAVAVGTSRRVGASFGAATEQAAIDGALAECSRQDRGCRVLAIGPFQVDPDRRADTP